MEGSLTIDGDAGEACVQAVEVAAAILRMAARADQAARDLMALR